MRAPLVWMGALLGSLAILSGSTHPHFKLPSHSTSACATSLDKCPAAGCGGGDKLLNKKKNNQKTAAEHNVISFDDFRHLESERPTTWKQNQSRKSVELLGEDTPVMLTGFLLGAHHGAPETCNCGLSGDANNDLHINLVEHDQDPQTASIVVEMPPKTRLKHPGWTLQNLDALPKASGHQRPLVRASGYLLFDSEHVTRSGGDRLSIWEIHPITKFEVCPSGACQSDTDEGWQDISPE